MNGQRQKCDNPRCPICYPNWKEEEEAARKKAEDDKQNCITCWRNLQKEAERIASNWPLRGKSMGVAFSNRIGEGDSVDPDDPMLWHHGEGLDVPRPTEKRLLIAGGNAPCVRTKAAAPIR